MSLIDVAEGSCRLSVQIGGAAAATRPRAMVNLEPGKVEQGLLKLVLSLVELLRQLMEKQAMRRIDAGSLSADDIDRVGCGLMELETKIRELQAQFGIADLNLDLGPIGPLLDRER
jgi:dissimilatory sulfite reductase (desulfoviridin) alpha/beta subunit